MHYNLPVHFFKILMNIVRIQNEQLLQIICEEEEINIMKVKSVLPPIQSL